MKLLERLDTLFHRLGNPPGFQWICDRYEQALTDGIEETTAELNFLADMAQRCPKCEGYEYPGVSHNRTSMECSEYDGGL